MGGEAAMGTAVGHDDIGKRLEVSCLVLNWISTTPLRRGVPLFLDADTSCSREVTCHGQAAGWAQSRSGRSPARTQALHRPSHRGSSSCKGA
jgi:hypothetical protein